MPAVTPEEVVVRELRAAFSARRRDRYRFWIALAVIIGSLAAVHQAVAHQPRILATLVELFSDG